MTTFFYQHNTFQFHDPGPGHPECRDRATAAVKAVEGLKNIETVIADKKASDQDLSRIHDESYVKWLNDIDVVSGYVRVDADTVLSPSSKQAMFHAAGAGIMAVDAVMAGHCNTAFTGVRPPGHHAGPNQAMGFCFINNVAVAVEYARHEYGLKRVAVLDFDVHHGNGTEDIFKLSNGLFYASSHQHPAFPGTGFRSRFDENVTIINAPLPPGSGSGEFRDAWDKNIFPELERYQPEFIMISAGFDAHVRDPLAQLCLGTVDYRWITERIMAMAGKYCQGRVVSFLEGGYDLLALEQSIRTHVNTLSG